MKKITVIIFSLCIAAVSFAQTAEDALTLSEEFYEGTARSMAMGNAFTALGGDLGAISINPASSGVFNCSQISFTPSLTTSGFDASYLGNQGRNKNTALTMSNFGSVITFDTGNYDGLVSFNFGIVYNKKNSFRSSLGASGVTDGSSMLSAISVAVDGIESNKLEEITREDGQVIYDPFYDSEISWPGILAWNSYVLAPLSTLGGKYEDVNDGYIASTENYDKTKDNLFIGGDLRQKFNRKVTGSNEEYCFNFGGNVNDIFYFGVNMNMDAINYTVSEYYEEVANNPDNFDDGFVSMSNSYWLKTSGAGINFKFGAIFAPMSGLRIGATFTTPTWYSLTDTWDYTMRSSFNNGNSYTKYSPTGMYDYNMTAPMRWSVGAAYTIFDRGLISADFERVCYNQIKLKDYDGWEDAFSGANSYMRTNFGASNILRLGAEARIGNNFAIRGGYNNYSPATKYSSRVQVASAGFGWNLGEAVNLDFAWTKKFADSEVFQLYNDYLDVKAPRGYNKASKSTWVCTLAIKF